MFLIARLIGNGMTHITAHILANHVPKVAG